MSTASDDGGGSVSHEIDEILVSFGNSVWVACLKHSGWDQREAKAALTALIVEAERKARIDELNKIALYNATEGEQVSGHRLLVASYVSNRKDALSISPQGQGVESLRDGEQQ